LLNFLESTAALLVLEFDGQERLCHLNQHAQKQLGNDQLGRQANEIFLDFRGTFSLKRCAQQQASGQLLNLSTVSGLPQTYYFSFYELNDGILALGQIDTLELDNLRQELVQSNNELNNLTRELHKKSAELTKLNELKNHFLGMAAHDLRNPLTVIMGYSELMAMEPENFKRPDYLHLLNDIRYLSDFMLSMINDLLDISIIEAGKLSLKLHLQYFSVLLSKTVEINQVFAQKSGIELVLDDQLPPGKISFDTPRIKQVLNNLISNALKFSPEGQKVIVNASLMSGQLQVSVIDNGPRIAKGDMSNLFQPYPDIKTKTTREDRQTGLGLAISRKIVNAHNGRIWAESVLGQGSTFTFSLPNFYLSEG
jgi:signal transduction histidine kinase